MSEFSLKYTYIDAANNAGKIKMFVCPFCGKADVDGETTRDLEDHFLCDNCDTISSLLPPVEVKGGKLETFPMPRANHEMDHVIIDPEGQPWAFLYGSYWEDDELKEIAPISKEELLCKIILQISDLNVEIGEWRAIYCLVDIKSESRSGLERR